MITMTTFPDSNESDHRQSSLGDSESHEDDPFFEQLVHDALDGFITLDESATICFANEAASDIFGYDVADLVGLSVERLFPDRYRESYLAKFRRYADETETEVERASLERIGLRANGEEVPLSFSLREHTYDGRRLFTAIVRDTSKQKRQQRELQAASEKYRTLVEAAPDAILVADAETGIIREANRAAVDLLGQPADEIEGTHQTELHPAEETDRYEQMFQGHNQRGGEFERSGDVVVVDADGQHVPVAINANVAELQDRRVIQGIFRDVSDRKRREDALETLHAATQRMLETTSPKAICEEAVRTATDALELSVNGINLAQEDGDALVPAATSDGVTDVLGDPTPSFTPADPLVWDVFDAGELRVIPDIRAVADELSRTTPMRSAIVAPVGDHGVFVASSTEVHDFDRIDVDLLRVLAGNTSAALTRAERERAVARQRDELTTMNRLNAIIRDINRTLVTTTTREEIEQTVCTRFADSDAYHGALVGDFSPVESGLRVRTAAGIDDDYLETIADAPVETERGAAAATLDSGILNIVEDVATDPSFPSSVREAAVEREYRSAVTIPIRYGQTTFGVLVVYAPHPAVVGQPERTVFAELGETIGYAINAAENKKLLHTDRVVELEFSLTETDAFFFTVSDDFECSVTLNGVVPSADGTLLFYVTASDVTPARLLARAEASARVERARLIRETNAGSAFEFAFRGSETAAQLLVERGAYISAGHADCGEGTLTVEVPADAEVRSFVTVVQDVHPGATLTAKRKRGQSPQSRSQLYQTIESSLTDRQLETLRTAYYSGYYEYPRDSTGETLADVLDISSPTFHQHLQAAHRKLLAAVFTDTDMSRRE